MNRDRRGTSWFVALALVLGFAAWFPSIFLGRGYVIDPKISDLPLAEKGKIFLSYFSGRTQEITMTAIEVRNIPSDVQKDCENIISRLEREFIPTEYSRASTVASSGISYYELMDNGGNVIRILRSFYQTVGDLENWFDVCIDIDLGIIYYFYISYSYGNRLTNTVIPNKLSLPGDPSDAAPVWGRLNAMEFADVAWNGVPGDVGIASYRWGDMPVNFKIDCRYHPGNMFDFKVIFYS